MSREATICEAESASLVVPVGAPLWAKPDAARATTIQSTHPSRTATDCMADSQSVRKIRRLIGTSTRGVRGAAPTIDPGHLMADPVTATHQSKTGRRIRQNLERNADEQIALGHLCPASRAPNDDVGP